MSLVRLGTPALALVLAVAACDRARPIVQESPVGNCTSCHGGLEDDSGAPPRDLLGRDADPAGEPARIGAHTTHLQAGVPCESCHVVPSRRDDPGHFDASPGAEVTFGPAAQLNGATPAYSGGTCSGVYCHGATLNAGGSATSPRWGDRLSGCGTCHAYPPPSHGTASDCSLCHGASVNDDDASIKPGGAHLNGSIDLDVTSACTGCHGDSARVTSDPLNKAAPATGAHLPHLLGGVLAGGFRCQECHALPHDLTHADGPPAEVAFGGPRGNQGTSPSYAAGTCSNVYCHGTTLLGGTNKTPLWTGASQAQCGTCHGRPPTAPHPQVDKSGVAIATTVQCSQCHPGTVFGPSDASPGTINVANGLHVNGAKDIDFHAADWPQKTNHGRAANYDDPAWPAGIAACRSCHGANLDGGIVSVSCDSCHTGGTSTWRTTCTFCHGDANRLANAAAPPAGSLDTEISTSDRAVGAHQKHLGNGSTLSNGVACTECHAVPTGIAHVDGAVQMSWGTLARTGGASPTWNGTTCAASYCHGSTLPGTGRANPTWAPPTALGCGSCHQPSPTTGRHPAVFSNHGDFACSVCHGAGFTAGTSVDKALHVNGAIDKAASLNWQSTPVKSCDPACHGRKDW